MNSGRFRSFSFRIGAVFFVLILASVMTLRVISFHNAVQAEERSIQKIIMAHQEQIERGVERDGMSYATYLVNALTEEPDDRHLILALKTGTMVYGNLRAWPDLKPAEPAPDGTVAPEEWQRMKVSMARSPKPVDAIIAITKLRQGKQLIVGYNLVQISQMKHALLEVLFLDVWLSIAAALLLTFLLVYAVSRHLEKVNAAYRHVMAGDIGYRVKDSGSRDEFAKHAAHFNEMMDWVASLISTLKDSTNSIAHDLRTPLARIRLRLQQMETREDLNEWQQEVVSECIDDIDHLTGIFNGILEVAKAEDLSIVRQFEAIDLKGMMEDLVDYYSAALEDENRSITLHLPEAPLAVKGEKRLLSQAVANLIGNAAKYSFENGEIAVSLLRSERHKGMVEIVVADRGPGIPEEYREKVKQRFYRLDESRNTPGTGLGLNLADAVVRLHKGKLVLEDNNPGLRSVVILPEYVAEKKIAA